MLLLILAFLTPDASAWQVRNNDHGQELSWGSRTISYQVDSSNNQGLSEDAISTMIAAGTRSWTQPVGEGLAFSDAGRAQGVVDPHDGKNIIFFDESWEHDPALVGITFVWSRPDGEIVGFDMALNTQDHSWAVDGTEGYNDLLNTLSHEFGHAIGVDHSPDVQSATMYPSMMSLPCSICTRPRSPIRRRLGAAARRPHLGSASCLCCRCWPVAGIRGRSSGRLQYDGLRPRPSFARRPS
jgi:hypothetical protein